MENGTYEQIVSHLERKLELNGLKTPDELQIYIVTQQATQQNPEKPTAICHHCKKSGHYRNQCVNSNEKKTKPEITRIVLTTTAKILVVKQTLTPTKKFLTIPTQTIQRIKKTEDPDLSTHPVRPVVKLNPPQRNVTLEQTQRTDRFSGTDDSKDRIRSNKELP